MKKGADVKSLQALEDAKHAVVEFREVAQSALIEGQSEVQRTIWWIQNEARFFWKAEIKRRAEKVNQARADVERARLAAMDQTAGVIDQKRALERAIRAYHESQEKLKLVEKWGHVLDREYMLYRGRCQGMARAVEGELPKAEAQLTLYADRIAKYLSVRAVDHGKGRRSRPPKGESS